MDDAPVKDARPIDGGIALDPHVVLEIYHAVETEMRVDFPLPKAP
jgi:hypothetical protein